MKTKQLENLLNISNEEIEFVKSVKSHLEAISQRKFEIWDVKASIEYIEMQIYVFPQTLVFRLLKDVIQIFKEKSDTEEASVLEMEIKNNEIYNNIIDKLNEKKREYLSVSLLELTRLED
jgi:hypothetical protein